MSKTNDCGVFYVAAGKKYVEEACVSAKSLKKLNPDIKIAIACNQEPVKPELFEKIIHVDEKVTCRNEGLLFKTKYLYKLAPFAKTLFVDTDTYFLKDITPGFSVLDYFDLAMTLSIADTYYPKSPQETKIHCKPVNTGVIFFQKNELNDRLFAKWVDTYSHRLEENPHLKQSDQTSCTEAIMHAQSRFYPLPNEWNTRFCFINTLREPVRILHAHANKIEKIGELINQEPNKQRVWLPHRKKCEVFRPYTWRHKLGKIRDQIKQLGKS